MSSTRFQDKRSILKNQLYSYILAMNYSKRKILKNKIKKKKKKKTTHLKWYQKEILRNRFNRKL